VPFPLSDPQIQDQAAQRNLQVLGVAVGKLTQLHFAGNGSPEGVVTAHVGAHYHRLDGGAGTCFYVKESSPTPSTGWVAK
jgi:hypothetical protein